MIQSSPSLLLKAIHDQTQSIPPDFVYVIDIISIRFGGQFTPEISYQLQRFRNLQMLTLNDCGIVSLKNFPHLPNLIRLDLVFNQITGEDLGYLSGCRHLQTLMLGANKIQKIQHINQLSHIKGLLQLDLINNPVYRTPGYRQKIFQIFPSLAVLDTLDRSGKDAYNNVTMMETVNRVPGHLFSHSDQEIRANALLAEQKVNLRHALSRLGSLDRIKVDRKRGQNRKNIKRNTRQISRQAVSDNLFSSNRVRRMLKQKNVSNMKISKSSGIYMAAVLEYLTAQFLIIASEEAINQRRSRITPMILKDCLSSNQELAKLLRTATFGVLGDP